MLMKKLKIKFCFIKIENIFPEIIRHANLGMKVSEEKMDGLRVLF